MSGSSRVFQKRLIEEKDWLSRQFPAVTALNDPPTVYEGTCRCEKGPVKELADKEIWPFTEYVQMHRFRLELPEEYPLKHPIATWLTDISHPDIVPNMRGMVSLSVLGASWRPDLRLVTIVNSLTYLLVDPNPSCPMPHPNCLKAAEVLRKYGFPRKGK